MARKNGLYGYHLLGDGDPAHIVYSLTLYERSEGANLMRLQTDTLDQPLNINSGTKLELGSSAKFRTLANYLEIIAALHEQYHSLSRAELAAVEVDAADNLSRWVISYLSSAGNRGPFHHAGRRHGAPLFGKSQRAFFHRRRGSHLFQL